MYVSSYEAKNLFLCSCDHHWQAQVLALTDLLHVPYDLTDLLLLYWTHIFAEQDGGLVEIYQLT